MEEEKKSPEKKPKEDILNIVKGFISYFEEMDRRKQDDNRIKSS